MQTEIALRFYAKNLTTGTIHCFSGTPDYWNLSSNYQPSNEKEYLKQTYGRYRRHKVE